MSTFLRSLLLIATLGWLCAPHFDALAQEPDVEAPAIEQPAPAPEPELEVERDGERDYRRHHDVIVHIGDDSRLDANESANSVIAIFGSASAAGHVNEAVIALGGDAHLTGSVDDSVVAIFGDVHVDGHVGQSVVALLGSVTLGPKASVEGEVVSVGGMITRDAAATVLGPQRTIAFGESFGRLDWLRPWFEHCLLYARPLAFEPGLEWAWWTAFGFLALYVVIALLFDNSVQRCVTTFEERPAQTVVASILTVLLTPMVLLLLTITIIGALLVPFVAIGVFCAALFGKAVVLGTIGRRITRFTGVAPFSHIAFATLTGGLIVTIMYVIPVIGFIAYNVIGILGLGVVVYTLILAMRARSGDAVPAMAAAGAVPAAAAPIDMSSAPLPATDPPAAPPTNVELTALPRADFLIRMGALLIDLILVGVALSAFDPSEKFTLVMLAGYGALMWKLKGTTIGGIICNLRVVRTDGRDIEWETAIVRALSCFLSLAPVGLGFFWMLFDANRQTWHDKIAGTIVVRVPKNQPLV
jgi:uncharacterized RDD family membrane protein YckC